MIHIPHFICVGAARSGTSSLWYWLNQHPLVHVSPIKETNYFARDMIHRAGPGDLEAVPDVGPEHIRYAIPRHAGLISDKQTYIHAITGTHEQCCGEICPSYLFYAKKAAPRIYTFNPYCKIIILLREPVSRALSQYAIFLAAGREPLPFHQAIREEETRLQHGFDYGRAYKGLGLYYEPVNTYLSIFGRNQVWVGLYDDLLANPQKTFDNVCQFLDLPHRDIDSGAKVHQSPISIGPLLRLARTGPGHILAQFTPKSTRRWLRTKDGQLSVVLQKHRQRESRILHDFYIDDVEKLDELLPNLGIKVRWNY